MDKIGQKKIHFRLDQSLEGLDAAIAGLSDLQHQLPRPLEVRTLKTSPTGLP